MDGSLGIAAHKKIGKTACWQLIDNTWNDVVMAHHMAHCNPNSGARLEFGQV